MLSYVGFFIMVVGAVVVFIDYDYKKPVNVKVEPDKRIDAIMSELTMLRSECNQDELKIAIDKLSKKHEALDLVVQTVKNQKPPQVHVQVPETVGVRVLTPVEISGALNLETPPGKRLRVLHKKAPTAKKK